MSNGVVKKTDLETRAFLENVKTMSKEDRIKSLMQMTSTFQECLKHGEEKVSLAIQTYDMVERHVRRLDDDLEKFELEFGQSSAYAQIRGSKLKLNNNDVAEDRGKRRVDRREKETGITGRNKRARVAREELISEFNEPKPPRQETPKKEKQVKQTASVANTNTTAAAAKPNRIGGRRANSRPLDVVSRLTSPLDMPVDPNEPLYCICDQVSFGEMIACDDNDCEKEWFHYPCVGLSGPPKGAWFCPDCAPNRV